MADDLTLRIGAQAQQAIDQVERTRQTLQGLLSTAKQGGPAFDQFGGAVTKSSQTLPALGAGLTTLAASIGVTFSVGAVVNFARKVVDAADATKDLAGQMGVNVEAAQRLSVAARQTGSDANAVTTAIVTMSRNLVENSKSSQAAVKALGLDLKTLRAAKPDEAFLLITDAIQRIPDPMRQVQLALELFGRSGKDLLPGIRDGFRDLADAATVMSERTVNKLEAAKQKWEDFAHTAIVKSAEVLAALMDTDRELEAAEQRRQKAGVGRVAFYGLGARPMPLVAGDADRALLGEQAELAAKLQAAWDEAAKKGGDLTGVVIDLSGALGAGAPVNEEYAKALQAFLDQILGRDLAAQVRLITDAYQQLTPAQRADAVVMAQLAAEIEKVAKAGATLTPVLERLRQDHARLNSEHAQAWYELDRIEQETRAYDTILYFVQRGITGVTAAEQKRMTGLAQQVILQGRQNQGTAEYNTLLAHLAYLQSVATAETEDATETATEWKSTWSQAFGELGRGFEQLGNIAGEEMADVARAIGSGMALVDVFDTSFDKVAAGGAKNLAAGVGGIVGGISQAIVLAVELGKALHDAFTRSEAEKAAADIRRNFGVDVGENSQVAKDIEQLVKDLGIDRNLAIDLSLPDIIREGGGISAENFVDFRDRANELFDDIQLGGLVGDRARKALDETMAELGRHAIEQGGLWDEHFVAMLERAQAEGLELASVLELVEGQITQMPGALEAVTGATIHTQEEFDRLSLIALDTANAMVASGKNPVEAYSAISGSIAQLEAELTRAGFASNDALAELRRWSGLVERNRPVLTQIAGLNTLLTTQANIGQLNTERFARMQAQLRASSAELVEGGFSQTEMLVQMKPTLETILRLHAERGLAIDAETQALIDQAREQGILSEQQVDYQQVQLDLTAALVEAVGGELPESFRKARDAARDAAEGIQDAFDDVDATVPVEFDYPPDGPRIEVNVPGAAKGAHVKRQPGGRLFVVGEGDDDEWILRQRDLQELLQQAREAGARHQAPARILGSLLPLGGFAGGPGGSGAAIPVAGGAPAAAAAGAGSLVLNAHYHGPDADGFRRMMRGPTFGREFVMAIRDNPGGQSEELARALKPYLDRLARTA